MHLPTNKLQDTTTWYSSLSYMQSVYMYIWYNIYMWSSERHIWRARPLSSFKHVLVPTSSYPLVTSTWRWPTLFPIIFYYVWWLKKPSSDGVVNLYTKAQLRPSAGQRRYQSTSDGFGFRTLCYKWWLLFFWGGMAEGEASLSVALFLSKESPVARWFENEGITGHGAGWVSL